MMGGILMNFSDRILRNTSFLNYSRHAQDNKRHQWFSSISSWDNHHYQGGLQ
jgi:hypothetical protein